MALDALVRRYANTLYADETEKLTRIHTGRASSTKDNFLGRGEGATRKYVDAIARDGLEHITDLVDARVGSLLVACSRASVPIDDQTAADIPAEVDEVCTVQCGRLIASIRDTLGQYNLDEQVHSVIAGEIVTEQIKIGERARRRLSAKRDEATLDARTFGTGHAADAALWDVFICHAREDKADFAGPLAEALQSEGVRVWYDDLELKIGDSLRRSIDRGLAESRYGVVVLSANFFAKHWPQQELDGLVARETGHDKVILPIWHKIDVEGVRKFSPLLAGRFAATSSGGVADVVRKLLQVIRPTPSVQHTPPAPRPKLRVEGMSSGSSAELWMSLQQAQHPDYILLVENNSDDEAVIESITLMRGTLHLCPPSKPAKVEELVLPPHTKKQISSWRPSLSSTSTLRMKEPHLKDGQTIEIDIVVRARLQGRIRPFSHTILVTVDYQNHRITQFGG